MGTSRNDRSPDVPAWRPVFAALGRPDVPAERQAAEIWLSAQAHRDRALLADLGQPFVASIYRIASAVEGPEDALARFQREVSAQRPLGLSVELARLALAGTAAKGEGGDAFARQFFAEATAYYVARDLPSFVGAPGRIAGAREANELEGQIRDTVLRTLHNLPAPEPSREGWRQYAERALRTLTATGSKRR
jgi:hypothetical protein